MSEKRRRRRANRTETTDGGKSVGRPSPVSALVPESGVPLRIGEAAFSKQALWVYLGLIAAIAVIYAPVRHHAFLRFDDAPYLTENPQVSGGLTWEGVKWALTTGYAANWFPLTWLSHMLDVQLYGMNPGPHHLTNVFFHTVNSLLLFRLLHRMTGELGKSAFVAGLFATHPLHVESVAWVAERKDVLSTVFWMLTMWAYVEYVRRPGVGRYVSMLILFGLGLMAKPMLVTLPFVLLLVDCWPLERVRLRAAGESSAIWAGQRPIIIRLILEKLPMLAMTVASSIVTVLVQQKGSSIATLDALPLNSRVANALVSYITYIGKMILPAKLAAFYPYSLPISGWLVAGAILILVSVSVAVIVAARRYPYLPVGWLWYLGTLVPVIGLVQVGRQAMADRYAYVPLIGLFVIVAWGIPDLFRRWGTRSNLLAVAGGVAILACTIAARKQVGYWGNGIALWTHTLDVTSDNFVAHTYMGNALATEGKVSEAIAEYNKALRIQPNSAEAHNNLGPALVKQGRLDDAITQFSEALRIQPAFAEAHSNLGVTLSSKGRFAEAAAQYTESLRLEPNHPSTHYNLGLALAAQGKFNEALDQYSEALRINPNYMEAENDTGAALLSEGKLDESLVHFRQALRIKQDYAEAHNNLGSALARQGNFSEAITHFAEALRLKPEYADARRNLALAQAKQEEKRAGQ